MVGNSPAAAAAAASVVAGDATSAKTLDGVLAVNKPQGISSAQVLRNLQTHFDPSAVFAPTIAAEARRLSQTYDRQSRHNDRQKYKARQRKRLNTVKLGHGGTLDPLATGVLIVGVGSGTKELQNFLGCTKSYEATVLFGVDTDTYDILGKVVQRQPFEHVTRAKVLEQLARLKDTKKQRPPIFSALRHEGKRFYEYAREGKKLPIEIPERPVEVTELEMVEWFEPGQHDFAWPTEEVEPEIKAAAEQAAKDIATDSQAVPDTEAEVEETTADLKRKRESTDDVGSVEEIASKKQNVAESDREDQPLMSGALPANDSESAAPPSSSTGSRPAACKIRMTVSSGFYVRTLCHDLGIALGSAALMADLVRTRQQKFELGKNVFEYSELEKGEQIWAPQVEKLLLDWQSQFQANTEAASPPRYESADRPQRTWRPRQESQEQRRRRNSSSDEG